MTQQVQQPAQPIDRAATLAHTAALARQQVLLQRRHQKVVTTARAVCVQAPRCDPLVTAEDSALSGPKPTARPLVGAW